MWVKVVLLLLVWMCVMVVVGIIWCLLMCLLLSSSCLIWVRLSRLVLKLFLVYGVLLEFMVK